MAVCETCHGSGWHLHCPERKTECPFRCSPRCRLGPCPACNGTGIGYCCDGLTACNEVEAEEEDGGDGLV